MKNTLLRFLLVSFMIVSSTVITNAKDPVYSLVDKYESTKGFKVDVIDKTMVAMVSNMPGVPQIVKQLEEMVTVSYKGKNPSVNDMYDEAINVFDAEDCTQTKDFTEGDAEGKAFLIEDGTVVTKIWVVMKRKNELEVISMTGKFDEDSVNQVKDKKPNKKLF